MEGKPLGKGVEKKWQKRAVGQDCFLERDQGFRFKRHIMCLEWHSRCVLHPASECIQFCVYRGEGGHAGTAGIRQRWRGACVRFLPHSQLSAAGETSASPPTRSKSRSKSGSLSRNAKVAARWQAASPPSHSLPASWQPFGPGSGETS